MYNQPFTIEKVQTLEDINITIDLLYITQCRATKNALLNRLRRQLTQLTMVPYSIPDSNVIPVDHSVEFLVPALMQGPQGTAMMPQGMPQMMPQGMPQSSQGMLPEAPQGMPQGAQQLPSLMQENIPPYIPKTMQPRMQMPPSGGMPQRAPAPSGGQQGGGGAQQPPSQQQQPAQQQQPSQQQQQPAQQQRPRSEDLKSFTLEDLSRYDGKGNNPAYVAVNGMVYDVTDQPGWAAGSHFGLRAGLDQTGAYISCHTGQPMIDRLKVVGRLVK